jgi:hypothetical protein
MKQRFAGSLAAATMIAMLAVALVSAASDPVTRGDAARLQAKIDKINKTGVGTRPAKPVRTPVSETEVNAYLRYEVADQLPVGVADPLVSILGDGRVSGSATVDLTQVANSRKTTGGMLDPYSYLAGSLPITANGLLKSKDGVASFSLESVAISGVPVPVWILQEIVTSYTRSPTSPKGVALDEPFPLPAGIQEIQIDRGQAVVIQ